jgi:hypothetical protein
VGRQAQANQFPKGLWDFPIISEKEERRGDTDLPVQQESARTKINLLLELKLQLLNGQKKL